MSEKISDEVFDGLLEASRLSIESEERANLKGQLEELFSHFSVLEKFAADTTDSYTRQSEDDLNSGAIKRTLESRDLKQMTEEYMDGYFRVPKVLDN